jgi:hypothetical protein
MLDGMRLGTELDIHLGVKEAGRSLDDGGSGVDGLDLVDTSLGIGEDGDKLDVDVLGVHVL